MKTIRLSLLLIVASLIVMLARIEESATSASATPTCRYEAGALGHNYTPIGAGPIPDRNLFKGSPARNMSLQDEQAPHLFADMTGGEVEDDILRLYYDLSALSLKKRKVVFRNATPNEKSALWRTHLALVLVRRELNDWQKQVILSALSLATPEYFGVPSSDAEWQVKVQQPSRLLEERIFNAFSTADAAKIFATLGHDTLAAKSSASVLLNSINYQPPSDSGPYKQVNFSQFVAQDMELERTFCECATNSDYCGIWSACRGGGCAWTPDGCGTFWSYPCNGGCR